MLTALNRSFEMRRGEDRQGVSDPALPCIASPSVACQASEGGLRPPPTALPAKPGRSPGSGRSETSLEPVGDERPLAQALHPLVEPLLRLLLNEDVARLLPKLGEHFGRQLFPLLEPEEVIAGP